MSTLREQFNSEGYVLLRNFSRPGCIGSIYRGGRNFNAQIKRVVTGRNRLISMTGMRRNAMFEF